MRRIVDTGAGNAPLRVRVKPGGTVVGYLANGVTVDVDGFVFPNALGDWARFKQTIGGVPSVAGAQSDGYLYAVASYLREEVVAPPPPASGDEKYNHAKYQLGVNALQFYDYAERAMRDGCRFVMLMDNGGGAESLARMYPDSIVMYRRYHNSRLSPEQMVNALDVTWSTLPRNMYLTLSNESDTWNPNNLPEYFKWWVECVKLIWQRNPNAVVCFGTWGHGNPDWTQEFVKRYFREVVAPFLNANAHRVALDLHTYTKGRRRLSHPPSDAPIIGVDWFETRYVFAYTNGLSRDVKHVSGEFGVEAGAGGFTWANYTPEQFREWAIITVNASRKRQGGAPIHGRALYHYGEHAGWRGYWIQPYYGELTRFWREDVPYVEVAE